MNGIKKCTVSVLGTQQARIAVFVAVVCLNTSSGIKLAIYCENVIVIVKLELQISVKAVKLTRLRIH